jgi:pilus assembly protein Flp/PilA
MFYHFLSWLKFHLPKDEKGQDLAEYGMLIGVIALVVLGAVTLLGSNLDNVFTGIASEVGGWFGP